MVQHKYRKCPVLINQTPIKNFGPITNVYFFATYCYTSRRFGFATFGTINNVNQECSVVDPGPYVLRPPRFGSGSAIIWMDPDPFIIKQKSKKSLDFYWFVTSLWLFIFEDWCKSTFKKLKYKETNFVVDILKSHWRKRAGSGPGSVTHWYGSADQQHCSRRYIPLFPGLRQRFLLYVKKANGEICSRKGGKIQ